jgi:hypothetical protein
VVATGSGAEHRGVEAEREDRHFGDLPQPFRDRSQTTRLSSLAA